MIHNTLRNSPWMAYLRSGYMLIPFDVCTWITCTNKINITQVVIPQGDYQLSRWGCFLERSEFMCNSSKPMGTTTNKDRSIDFLYSGILFIWVPAIMQHVSLLNAGNLNCLHFIKHSASSPRDLAHCYGGGYFSHLSTQKLVLHMKRQEAGAGAKSAPYTRSLLFQ